MWARKCNLKCIELHSVFLSSIINYGVRLHVLKFYVHAQVNNLTTDLFFSLRDLFTESCYKWCLSL